MLLLQRVTAGKLDSQRMRICLATGEEVVGPPINSPGRGAYLQTLTWWASVLLQASDQDTFLAFPRGPHTEKALHLV